MTTFTRGLAAAATACALFFAGAAEADPNRLFADSRLVTLDRISVEVAGSGPNVILVPGLASSRETWRATAERLRAHYRVHLVQVAGFAGEPARANASGEVLAPTAEAIDAYVLAAKLKPAIYVGHSFGGTMGLYLAEHHGADFRKVLIVDAWPAYARVMTQGRPVTPDQAREMAEKMRAAAGGPAGPDSARAMERQAAFFTVDPARRATIVAWSQASDRPVVGQALYDDLTLDLTEGLAKVAVPVTLVYPDNAPAGMPAGMQDRIYQSIYASLPGKTLKPVAGSLHFVMWDQPESFAKALDDFLAN